MNHHEHTPDRNHHCHELSNSLSDKEKLARMIEHWIHHNSEHASSFQQWSERALSIDEKTAARLLDEVAKDTLELNKKLKLALASLKI